jgi:hypothetical protein
MDNRPVHSLFVDGLPRQKTPCQVQADLQPLFKPHGWVIKVDKKKGVGMGWLDIRSSLDSEDLCKALHGTKYDGRWLRIECTKKVNHLKPTDSRLYWTRQVIVKQIPLGITRDVIKHIFKEDCDIEPDLIILSQFHRNSFVTLPSEDDVKRCVTLLHNKVILGKKISVEPAKAPLPRATPLSKAHMEVEHDEPTDRQLLVGPVPTGITEQVFRQALSKLNINDGVEKIIFIFDHALGKFTGVVYLRIKITNSACQRLQGIRMFGRQISVEPYNGLHPPQSAPAHLCVSDEKTTTSNE